MLFILVNNQPKDRWTGPFMYKYEFPSYQNHEDIQKIRKVQLMVFKVVTRKRGQPFPVITEKPNYIRVFVTIQSASFKSTKKFLVDREKVEWISFDITNIFQNYLSTRPFNSSSFDVFVNMEPIRHTSVNSNYLTFKIYTVLKGFTEVTRRNENKPIRNQKIRFATDTDTSTRGLFVIFSDASTHKTMLKEEVEKSFRESLKHTKRSLVINAQRSKRNVDSLLQPCKLEKLKVHISFILPQYKSLGIVQPVKVEMNHCRGSCDLPLSQNSIQSTKHAEIRRAYIHQKGNDEGDIICCSPAKYHHTPYMFLKNGLTYIEYFHDGTVVKCRCS